eukprot:356499-Chlamydomonas_euryale.AAC.3
MPHGMAPHNSTQFLKPQGCRPESETGKREALWQVAAALCPAWPGMVAQQTAFSIVTPHC